MYHDVMPALLTRTTVSIDTDVYDAAVHISLVSGERLGEVLSRLARRGLYPDPPQFVKTNRFPTFSVPDGAKPIQAAKVQQVLDDEGAV